MFLLGRAPQSSSSCGARSRTGRGHPNTEDPQHSRHRLCADYIRPHQSAARNHSGSPPRTLTLHRAGLSWQHQEVPLTLLLCRQKQSAKRRKAKCSFRFFLLNHFWSLRFWELFRAGKGSVSTGAETGASREARGSPRGKSGVSPLHFSAEGGHSRAATSMKRFPYFETLPWLFFHRRWWSSLIFGNQHNFSCSRNLKISSPLLTNSLSTRTSQKKKPRHGDFNELTQGNKGSQEHTSLNYSPPQLPTKGITCSRRWISNQAHNVFVTEWVSSH